MLELIHGPQLVCTKGIQQGVAVSLGHPQSLYASNSSISSRSEVWHCTFFAACSLQTPLMFSRERWKHHLQPLLNWNSMSIFLLQQTFFCKTTPFSYMFFHSSYTNYLIKLYSTFSAINHFRIYSNLMVLQCHVRKQIKFIFVSLSYKTVCSNRNFF